MSKPDPVTRLAMGVGTLGMSELWWDDDEPQQNDEMLYKEGYKYFFGEKIYLCVQSCTAPKNMYVFDNKDFFEETK